MKHCTVCGEVYAMYQFPIYRKNKGELARSIHISFPQQNHSLKYLFQVEDKDYKKAERKRDEHSNEKILLRNIFQNMISCYVTNVTIASIFGGWS